MLVGKEAGLHTGIQFQGISEYRHNYLTWCSFVAFAAENETWYFVQVLAPAKIGILLATHSTHCEFRFNLFTLVGISPVVVDNLSPKQSQVSGDLILEPEPFS